MTTIIRSVLRIQTPISLRSGVLGTQYKRTQHTAAAPEVYTVPPVQSSSQKKPGQLGKKQLDSYFDKGFLVIPSFFSKEELQPVVEAINESVDIIANKLYRGGKIKDKCESAGFYERLILIEEQFKGSAVLLHKLGYLPVAFQQLWSNDRLLNMVEQLIGPDIAGHPVWNLRSKTPHNEQATVPWHQDNAYLDPTALNTLMPTAWIPLIDANKTNGCMQMVSGSHKSGKTATHTCCAGGTWYVEVEEEEMEKVLGADMERDIVTCEVPYGGLVLLNNCISHKSLENYSDKVRWSLDLRWQDPKKASGFYDMKTPIVMRKADDPYHKINWEEFATIDRNKLQEEITSSPTEEFSTNIYGPWMTRWDIVHHNKHTKSLKEGSSWHSPGDKA